MRLRAAPLAALPACGLLTACISDLDAPDPWSNLAIDCAAYPDGAVGAAYDATPDVDDSGRPLEWSATDLPAGLVIDPRTGRVSGVPTVAETASVEFTVTDDAGPTSQTCSLTINPDLDADIETVFDSSPFCLEPGGPTLLDLLVEGTGDGTPVRCRHVGGSGDGRLPAGVSINPDTCVVEGTVTGERFGTWVFIVEGQQSGAAVHVPYCVSRPLPTPGYSITMDHSGLSAAEGDDGTQVPIFRRFDPDRSLSVGVEGDPRFEVRDREACGTEGTCFFGFGFQVNASPFDVSNGLDLSPTGVLTDAATDTSVGFFHNLRLEGPSVDDSFRDRPWTVNIAMDYCLADSAGPCSGNDNVRTNGEGSLDFSVLMVPEPE